MILSQPCSSFSCLECLKASETAQIMKSGGSPVGKLDDSLRSNAMMMDKFRMLESELMKPIDFEQLQDNHVDFVDLEQDWIHNAPDTVPENSNRGDIHGASTECFTVPRLPEEFFQLRFMTSMPSHLFTEAKVRGEQGTAIQVALLDPKTGHAVQSGPGSMAKLNLFIVDGDVEEFTWMREQLERNPMSEACQERKPLLSGDLLVNLEGGMGTLGDFHFTQDSSRTKSGKYRLGVKVVCGCYAAMHIRGTLSEAFAVEDSHGEFAKKHIQLLPSDYVWRMVGVAMGGEAHKRLTGAGIVTVRDFVNLLSLDQSGLRNIVDGGISDAMWKHTLEHATIRVSDAKEYVYYFGEGQSNGICFNWNYEVKGLIRDGRFVAVESLSRGEKVYLESLAKIACKNHDKISEYHETFDPNWIKLL